MRITMVMPSQNALKLPAMRPDKMLSEAPPSRDGVPSCLTWLDSVDVKILTTSGRMAQASVPQVMTVESFHHSVPSPRPLTKSHEARYVIATDTKDVSHTSRVNGASKFMRATPAYWARTQASLIKYDAPLATIISTRIKKIQTRSCTCTAGSLTASRMNETYGVTGVALISFILLAVREPAVQVQLLVWIFLMRVLMIVASGASYLINEAWVRAQYAGVARMNFEAPLTRLVWLTSFVSVAMTYLASWVLVSDLGDGTLWWKLSTVITCGTLAGAIIPELVKIFTSTESSHVKEVVTSSREGGASLNILSGLIAGNFSAFWLGITIVVLMGIAYVVSTTGLGALMVAPAVFAFGLVAFGFLGMGPVTIAVDSYGPVTDNAQSVFELSVIETMPGVAEQIRRDYGFTVSFDRAKHLLEENDGAGNTFKATAKPVLIGTAVVGATTMIFSIIVVLTAGLTQNLDKLSLLHPPFLLGLITGGAILYWFTRPATQAVSTGAYRAAQVITATIRLEGTTKASVAERNSAVEICTQYAQKGMFNIFL